jgi:hypothetical protein
MKLNKLTPCQRIEIYQPRWKDRTVLIATYKVGEHNEIVFTKTKSLPDTYYISGEVAKSYPIQTNGTISCYAVPLSALEQLERI